LAACKQLAVAVAAVDTRNETLDASSDVDGIVHDVATDDARSASRDRRLRVGHGAEKAGKADGRV
jgi:hypothetical protein